MISVLILTLNEEVNLPRCLESVRWSDDVLVVDSFSTDETGKLARNGGARVIQNRFRNFADQRNFGLVHGAFKHDWVLHLDADEMVTPELRDEMMQAVKSVGNDAYQLSSKMMFGGRWLKHAGLFPWFQVRLGRRDCLSFIQAGHGQRESLAAVRIGTLKESLVHYSFSKGISDWVERHNRYSTAEAEHFFAQSPSSLASDLRQAFATMDRTKRRRALKRLTFWLPCRPLFRFFYMYVLRLGFMDGSPGLTYCCLLSVYEYLIALKVKEIDYRKRGLAL